VIDESLPVTTEASIISKESTVDSRLQVQLERDGGESTGQSWIETSDL